MGSILEGGTDRCRESLRRKKLLQEDLKESFELEQGDREGAAGNAVGGRQSLVGSCGSSKAVEPLEKGMFGSERCLTCCLGEAGWLVAAGAG